MISKEAFYKFINIMEAQTLGIEGVEQTFNVILDNCFLTQTLDNMVNALAESFFTSEELQNPENEPTVETVKDVIHYFCFVGCFGLCSSLLTSLYIEDEGLETERVFDGCTSAQLYTILCRYTHPEKDIKKFTIKC